MHEMLKLYYQLLQPLSGQQGGKIGVNECECVCVWWCICVCLCGCMTKHTNRGKERALYMGRKAGKGKIT